LGLKRNEKTKINISKSLKGRVLSEEHKKKILINLKEGSIKTSKVVLKIDLETNIILEEYKNLTEAVKFNKISKSCISAVCNGKQKQAGGYFWKYK